VSKNARYSFCFEADGDVVLYSKDKSIWKSASGGLPTQSVRELFLDNEDGQLVAQAANTEGQRHNAWLSIPNEQAVQGGDPFTATMRDDGNFVITRGDGEAIWATNTTMPGKAC
jgi:hypothetical protein